MFTAIGDVHGKFNEYLKLTEEHAKTVQVGDMGFDYSPLAGLSLDHLWFPGNHDNYDTLPWQPNCLGDWGVVEVEGLSPFFIRGAFSIDLVYRQGEMLGGSPKTWWWQEELRFSQMMACLETYKTTKPSIVLSHAAPLIAVNELGNPNIMRKFGWGADYVSMTSSFLQEVFDSHQPDLWVFGHYHTSWNKNISGTEFRCLRELETFGIN